MAETNRIRIAIYTAAIIAAMAFFSWLGYTLYNRINIHARSPFDAVPGNTALIIQLNKAGNLFSELNRSNLLWKALSRFPGFRSIRDELDYVDSAGRKNETVSRILQNNNILISITLSGRNNFGALYLMPVNGADPESHIISFISEVIGEKGILSETPYSTTRLHRIHSGGDREAFYFAVMKGIFIGSFHGDLVKRAIDRLSLNTPLATSPGFRKVQATTGKRVDANIYVNYRFFSLVLSKITRDEMLPSLLKFSDFADWSGLDLIIKKDELMFNGITIASDSSRQFLSLFTDQQPQKKEISAIIPETACYFTSFGWSDPARFCQRFRNRGPRDEGFPGERNDMISMIDRYQLNVSEFFLPWIGNEGCLFVLEDPVPSAEKAFAAFKTRDTRLTLTCLFSLADTLGIRYDSVKYNEQQIYRLSLPAFIPALFGEMFGRSEIHCFTFLKDYIVFGLQPKDLERVIKSVSESATMANNKVFNDFEDNLSDRSNVFTYYNTGNSMRSLKAALNQDLAAQMEPMLDSLRKFESIAFQYSNTEGQFYSSFFLRYNPNFEKEGPLRWQVALDTTVAGQPQILQTTISGAVAIAAADVAGNLYLVSPQGEIVRKLPVMGRIMGRMHPVRNPGTDSISFLFNTDTHLYMLHADGTIAEKFPMRFPLHATNGIEVADWEDHLDYRIFVAFQDNRVYCFTLDGISHTDWKRPNLREEITDPVTVCSAGGKDYILVTGKTGSTLILGPDGELHITPGPKFVHAPLSGFHLNRTNRKGVFLTTSPEGKVLFIQENGRTSEVTLNLFTPDHRFFYEDITGNGQPEFIYSDRNSIFYYNRNYKLIYSYAFRREISEPPFLLHGRDGKALIGYVVQETNELFLFDHHGYCELESGIRGNTPFDIGFLDSIPRMNLVVGAGKFLRAYSLPEP